MARNIFITRCENAAKKIKSIIINWMPTTLTNQMRMMSKYVIPPRFDFMEYKDITKLTAVCPMMYIFQFRALLDEKDLANIWQNIMPSSRTSAANGRYSNIKESEDLNMAPDVKYVSHFITNHGNFRPDQEVNDANPRFSPVSDIDQDRFLNGKVRWLVFKAKMRAETDLAKIKQKSIDKSFLVEESSLETSSNRNYSRSATHSPGDPIDYVPDIFSEADGVIRHNPDEDSNLPAASDLQRIYRYGYNWPYDFFSLVELVKVEAKMDFVKR